MIYDDNGNLVNKKAIATGRQIERLVGRLYVNLRNKGMTPVEGRALRTHLMGCITVPATVALLQAQCKGVKR